MQISAQQAIIKTAQVEVKTLNITGKQVTLAVFRQLDKEPLLDYDTKKLNGIAWGRINYHPDKCSGSDHIHIVWQKDSSLFRDTIPKFCRGEDSREEELTKIGDEQKWKIGTLLQEINRDSIAQTGCSPNYGFFRIDTTNKPFLEEWTSQGFIDQSTDRCYRPNLSVTGTVEFQRLFNALSYNIAKRKQIIEEVKNFHSHSYDLLQKLDLLFIAV